MRPPPDYSPSTNVRIFLLNLLSRSPEIRDDNPVLPSLDVARESETIRTIRHNPMPIFHVQSNRSTNSDPCGTIARSSYPTTSRGPLHMRNPQAILRFYYPFSFDKSVTPNSTRALGQPRNLPHGPCQDFCFLLFDESVDELSFTTAIGLGEKPF